jgi:hypothetical protein
MNTAGRLSAYGAALALVAVGAWVIGNAVGPFARNDEASAAAGHGDTHSGTVAGPHNVASTEPAGLASAKGAFTFTPTGSTLAAGTTTPFSFKITGPGGAPVTQFDVEHDKRMHLIVVRRDTADFQHVHPEMAPDGTWTVPLKLALAGSYRAFADFHPTGGEKLTLGVDLAVPGVFTPRGYATSRVALVDGYQVNLDGDLVPGQSAKLTLTVRKDGREVTDLQPYLGAYGHLVALRGGDLAYLHVHPEGTPGDGKTASGPTVTFFAEVPSAGTYRLFLDFQHGGKVRTAEFTVSTAGVDPVPAPAPVPTTEHSHSGGGH